MARPTEKELYRWMDMQIVACDLQSIPADPSDPYYIKNASSTEKRIHVYNIDNLCDQLGLEYKSEPHSKGDEFDCHYIMYRGYRFFGLEDINDDERE